MADNMHYYELFRRVPEEACKAFDNGTFKGTDINPQWRIQMLTEAFGPCGIGWYYTIDKQWSEENKGVTLAYCNVSLYVRVNGEWSKPIMGTGGNWEAKEVKGSGRASDECYKMALTDALSIACKALGIGADIWFSKGQTKYTMSDEDGIMARTDKPANMDEVMSEIQRASTMEELQTIYASHKELQSNQTFLGLLTSRKQQIARA